MSTAFPHAEEFIKVTQILATKDPTPQDRAKVLGFLTTLVQENAKKDEALVRCAAENDDR